MQVWLMHDGIYLYANETLATIAKLVPMLDEIEQAFT